MASKAKEEEWREKAKKELEDWHVHQSEQMEKNKANNRLAAALTNLLLLIIATYRCWKIPFSPVGLGLL